ncbi:MAG: VOC family protein [Paralcaligenes sp.]
MRQHLTGVDHVVVATPDLARAARQYADLGFQLMPRGVHTVGSENHCIMFGGGDYFELFGVPASAHVAPAFNQFLAHGPGLVSAVLSTDDALMAQEELARDSLPSGELRKFSRQVNLAGVSGTARFRTLDIPAQLTPGLHVFCCQHYTRELVWTPGSDVHPNGVQGIDSILLCSADPKQTIDAYARLLDCVVRKKEGLYQIKNQGAAICVGSPARLNNLYPGIASAPAHPLPCGVGVCFRVADLAETEQTLLSSRVEFVKPGNGVIHVAAACAEGVSVLFVAAGHALA